MGDDIFLTKFIDQAISTPDDEQYMESFCRVMHVLEEKESHCLNNLKYVKQIASDKKIQNDKNNKIAQNMVNDKNKKIAVLKACKEKRAGITQITLKRFLEDNLSELPERLEYIYHNEVEEDEFLKE